MSKSEIKVVISGSQKDDIDVAAMARVIVRFARERAGKREVAAAASSSADESK